MNLDRYIHDNYSSEELRHSGLKQLVENGPGIAPDNIPENLLLTNMIDHTNKNYSPTIKKGM